MIRIATGLLAAILLAGCPQQYPDPLAAESGHDECGSVAYAKLIAARAIELHQVCGKVKMADCTHDAANAIRAKYEKLLDNWEECK